MQMHFSFSYIPDPDELKAHYTPTTVIRIQEEESPAYTKSATFAQITSWRARGGEKLHHCKNLQDNQKSDNG